MARKFNKQDIDMAVTGMIGEVDSLANALKFENDERSQEIIGANAVKLNAQVGDIMAMLGNSSLSHSERVNAATEVRDALSHANIPLDTLTLD